MDVGTFTDVDRAEAEALDAADLLARFRERFLIANPELIYLDGNSLGRMPKAAAAAVESAMREGWGERLVGVWDEWLDIGQRVGDRLGAALLGTGPGQVAISDSTTVNLYKLANAALDLRPGRRVILTSRDNFPSDRYVFEGLAAARGLELRWLEETVDGIGERALRDALGPEVALVSICHVSYRSAAVEDMARLTAVARDSGALVLWDLCHSVGAIPIELEAWGVDLAVGCTYKYVNAGPGAPAFLYVRRGLQERLRQPIWGWFGQRDQFGMGPTYDPEASINRFLVGTPPVLSVLPIQVGVDLLAEAGMERLRSKAVALTDLVVRLWEAWLEPCGVGLASPRDPARRGSHVALSHPDARRLCQCLIAAGVVPDFRPPNLIRLGIAPIYTRFVDVWDGLNRLHEEVRNG
jgi:kynureninase